MTAEHTYPRNYGPGSTWSATMAWGILDQAPPGAIPERVRFMLGGELAGAFEAAVQLTQEGRLPPKGPISPSRVVVQNFVEEQVRALAGIIGKRAAARAVRPEGRLSDDVIERAVTEEATEVLTRWLQAKPPT